MATDYNAQSSGVSHRKYNDPMGAPSDIGSQIRTDYYQKKALIEAKKEQYFSQMADVTSMPKNMGKTIKRYHYLPLLDDANINDQGIDADGVIQTDEYTVVLVVPGVFSTGLGVVTQLTPGTNDDGYNFTGLGTGAQGNTGTGVCLYAVGATQVAAEAVAAELMEPYATVGANYATNLPLFLAAGGGVNEDFAATGRDATGNLYGSSKDVGTIVSKLPALSENGGRVNRVGFKRVELEGAIEKFGFFDEYTQESLDFDTDAELDMHINREMVMGANEMTEDALQIDLLNGAGVVRYGGDAITKSEIHGDIEDSAGDTDIIESLINYEDLMRLSIDLDNNRCPKSTKIITGTRMIDTNVVDAARYLYIGSELIPSIKRMKDLHGNPAFIQVQHYASAGTIATGEIGTVDQFRIIVVPEMMHWAGAGGVAGVDHGTTTTLAGPYRTTGGNYDVFPMLVVGSGSFTTIGFQTDGKTVKFKITHKKPGKDIANRDDPYGEVGFMSIKWYYGTMILRPERLALCMSVAEL